MKYLFIILCLINNTSYSKVICDGDCSKNQKIQKRNEINDEYNKVSEPVITNNKQEPVKENAIEIENKKKNKSQSHKSYAVLKYFNNENPPINAAFYEENRSNLPNYFKNLNTKEDDQDFSFIITPKYEAKLKLSDLYPGSILKIIIQQDIVASQKTGTPVRGLVMSGPYKGSIIYGEAKLEEELKRVLFDFKTISGGRLQSEYVLKAKGLDVLGRIGEVGNYHANDITFGIASFFATGAAIAADAQVSRTRNQNGDWVDEPSADNAAKKGLSGAVGKVAERLSDRALNAPGRTEITGPIFLQIILDESPFLKR